jgi:hypothetical protein
MSAEFRVERNGDTWALAWDTHSVAMGFERLRETSDGLKGVVTIESTLAGRVAGPVNINLHSTISQSGIAKFCHKRVNSLSDEAWHSIVVQACAVVAKQFAQPTPVIDLSLEPDPGPVEYLIPGLVPLSETTVMYGDGESAKSLLALRIALSVSAGEELPWGGRCVTGNVLYLDWETNSKTVTTRWRRLAIGETIEQIPKLFYRQCFRSLADELPSIREEIDRKLIKLVIVDSIGFALSGSLTEDEPARAGMNALRSMSPATRLAIAHVSKGAAAQESGPVKPFGSAFFWNGMRSGIEIRRGEDSPSENLIDLGVFHRKSNDERHYLPFGLNVLFDEGRGRGILFARANIADVPDLAARTGMSLRLYEILKRGHASVEELADELDAKEDSVYRTLKKMKSVTQIEPGGGRGRPSVWGLAQ